MPFNFSLNILWLFVLYCANLYIFLYHFWCTPFWIVPTCLGTQLRHKTWVQCIKHRYYHLGSHFYAWPHLDCSILGCDRDYFTLMMKELQSINTLEAIHLTMQHHNPQVLYHQQQHVRTTNLTSNMIQWNKFVTGKLPSSYFWENMSPYNLCSK